MFIQLSGVVIYVYSNLFLSRLARPSHRGNYTIRTYIHTCETKYITTALPSLDYYRVISSHLTNVLVFTDEHRTDKRRRVHSSNLCGKQENKPKQTRF